VFLYVRVCVWALLGRLCIHTANQTTHTYTYIYSHMHIHIHIPTHAHTHTHTHTCTHTYACALQSKSFARPLTTKNHSRATKNRIKAHSSPLVCVFSVYCFYVHPLPLCTQSIHTHTHTPSIYIHTLTHSPHHPHPHSHTIHLHSHSHSLSRQLSLRQRRRGGPCAHQLYSLQDRGTEGGTQEEPAGVCVCVCVCVCV
jgi:hypothetical protein